MAKGNKHQGLPVVESSAMESEFQSYVDETAAKMFAMQGSISEVAKELSNLCTDLLSEMRAMFLELRAAPPPPNRSLEPDEAEPPPPEILTIEEPRQTPPEAQTQAGVRGKAPATISSPNSSTLGTSGINTNSVEGSTSSNSITSSNRVVTYREVGHGEVVLGLHNDVFPHLNDVPNSEPTGIGVIQPRVTAMVTTNTLYPSTMCGTLYPSTVNGTFVMDVMGGRTESGQYWHENLAGVNSGMYSSASAGFLMDPRGAPHLQHTKFSSRTGLPPFSQSSGSQFSQAIGTTPTSHFSVPNPAIFRAKENNQKMNSCEKNATYLSDEVLQSNWLCNVGKKMAVYRGIRDKGGGIKTHCDCNVSLMSTEGIGVKIDGRQGPYSCECHALKVFDKMPTSDVFCGRRVAALTSIRDKGGGLGKVVKTERVDRMENVVVSYCEDNSPSCLKTDKHGCTANTERASAVRDCLAMFSKTTMKMSVDSVLDYVNGASVKAASEFGEIAVTTHFSVEKNLHVKSEMVSKKIWERWKSMVIVANEYGTEEFQGSYLGYVLGTMDALHTILCQQSSHRECRSGLLAAEVNRITTNHSLNVDMLQRTRELGIWDGIEAMELGLELVPPREEKLIVKKAIGANFAVSLNSDASFANFLECDYYKMQELMRPYVTIHSEHEGRIPLCTCRNEDATSTFQSCISPNDHSAGFLLLNLSMRLQWFANVIVRNGITSGLLRLNESDVDYVLGEAEMTWEESEQLLFLNVNFQRIMVFGTSKLKGDYIVGGEVYICGAIVSPQQLGDSVQVSPSLPPVLDLTNLKWQPAAILARRIYKKGSAAGTQWLGKWEGVNDDEATWEDAADIQLRFPGFDKVAGSRGQTIRLLVARGRL